MHAPNASRLPPVLLTPRDFARLEIVARLQLAAGNLAGRFLRRELERAVVCLPDELPRMVVTMRSQVRFRVEGMESATRILSYPEDFFTGGQCLSIASPVGAALIGLTEGAVMPFRDHCGKASRLLVEHVVQPPEFGASTTAGPSPAA